VNIQARSGDAERAQSEGDAIYRTVLPALKRQGVRSGFFVGINIENRAYVVAETRRDLMLACKEKLGRGVGWVKQVEY